VGWEAWAITLSISVEADSSFIEVGRLFLQTQRPATRMPLFAFQPKWDALVVDDDESIRELLISYFSSRGLNVTGAQDGRAAIAAIERSNGRFGLVITDLSLPGADGFAVLQAARSANASCYVVIVTGYASLDSAIYAVRVGAYDYLTKPFSLGQLDVMLKRIADRASLEKENRDLVKNPSFAPSQPSSGLDARNVNINRIEATLTRVEQLLMRLESRLDLVSGVPSVRR
jgi:DNA-binding NtrC family response regulator